MLVREVEFDLRLQIVLFYLPFIGNVPRAGNATINVTSINNGNITGCMLTSSHILCLLKYDIMSMESFMSVSLSYPAYTFHIASKHQLCTSCRRITCVNDIEDTSILVPIIGEF